MAQTKKSLAIQAEKEALREQIEGVNEQIQAATTKVPLRVRQGSHNEAIAWKSLAEKSATISGAGAEKASVRVLKKLLSARHSILKQLQ